MKKENEWLIYVQDNNLRQFSFIGPLQKNQIYQWLDVASKEQDNDREILFNEIELSNRLEYKNYAEALGFSETKKDLLPLPKDRSNEYKGNIPKYANKADPERIIHILCKGKCKKTTLAEINRPYPGKETLKSASLGDYKATCLQCGHIAQDNYNWYR
ncbi:MULTISPECIES: hypothetical protein [Delftia]|uniref:Uncharacterized protein n=1 Tax=Delftia lacustris TaxID=558537 RepID=A0A7T2YUM1_9BURK|nr:MULTISPECIES: hypothetical protein [Delftia]KAA9176554.1 hypothetical protein F3K36_11240 [Delftia sp. BR1]QPS82382.1 hypothetical protein I6G47_04655 [Delftia lacustris]